jgi:hypothetical protein
MVGLLRVMVLSVLHIDAGMAGHVAVRHRCGKRFVCAILV